MNIPSGNSNEDYKQRKDIISQLYREWTYNNPEKKVLNPSLKGYVNIRFYQSPKPCDMRQRLTNLH